ncbi:MAG: helix-turn-helix transcriptional regulator [Ruminococcaceae bacterium]|nr:helix-turn-helix transcriptional regulator [Oscillospiraceae bacterium]
MNLTLGNKIKELRKRDGRKQEDLALAIGVTNQAVSRWESGGCYPDIEIIPAIANYFNVSIDELFGYNNDRENKIKNILTKASDIITKQGFTMYQGCLPDEFEECINMLRLASEEFPGEPKILLKLAQALLMWGWNKFGAKGHKNDVTGNIEDNVEYNSKNIYWQEAVQVYEKALRSNPNAEDRSIAIRQLTPLYCRMGEYDKAKKLANEQDTIVICKELLLPMATVGDEKARYQDERILALLTNLQFSICESIALRPDISSTEYGKNVVLSLIKLYETIFIDGKCGGYHGEIGHLYLDLTKYEMNNNGSMETILGYFNKVFDHYKESVRIYNDGEYVYSAPLVANLNPIAKGELSPVDMDDFWNKTLKFFRSDVLDEIRKNPKFAECFE